MHRSPACIMSSSCLVHRRKTRLLPLHHPCSPFMLLAGHSRCGRGRVGVQGRSCCSVQREGGRYTLCSSHSCMLDERNRDTARGGTEGTSLWFAARAQWLWLLHHVRFFCGCTQRQCLGSSSGISPLPWCEWQQDVAALDGWGETAASLQRLKTHFQRAAGAGVGISLPWHGHEVSLAASCWGFCGWGGGGDCLHAHA